MKYFLLVIIFIFSSSPVLAAKQVNGTVPELAPLQPLPEGVYVNPSGNINFTDPSHAGQFDEDGNIITNQEQDVQKEDGSILIFGESISNIGKSSSKLKNIIGAIVILIILGLGVYFIKPRFSNGK